MAERQRLISHELQINPEPVVIEFEDVFGNRASRFEINQPYDTLTISAESVVELCEGDPFGFANLPVRPASFPLGWMPWERMMLSPYLMATELPDTQLREIYDYAMQFVERNNRDLMETLFAINLELFNEYRYVPGSTSMNTSPYEVMRTPHRRLSGLCKSIHLHGPPAEHPRPIRLRIRVHRQSFRRSIDRSGPVRCVTRVGAALHSRNRLEEFRPDQRHPALGRPHHHRRGPALSRYRSHRWHLLWICPGKDDASTSAWWTKP